MANKIDLHKTQKMLKKSFILPTKSTCSKRKEIADKSVVATALLFCRQNRPAENAKKLLTSWLWQRLFYCADKNDLHKTQKC
jgi:hypothetical protein